MAGEVKEECGDVAEGMLGPLVCVRPKGHGSWHESRVDLRDGVERTNWGSDGLSIFSSKDRFKGHN